MFLNLLLAGLCLMLSLLHHLYTSTALGKTFTDELGCFLNRPILLLGLSIENCSVFKAIVTSLRLKRLLNSATRSNLTSRFDYNTDCVLFL